MSDPVADLLTRCKSKGLLVDTNILLLYFVGRLDRRVISTFKRTRQFVAEDFDLLVRLFDWFGAVATTPNILTEVNNLASQLPSPHVRRWRERFQVQVATLSETYSPSAVLANSASFLDCGLTDAGVIERSRDGLLAMTDDLRLYILLQTQGVDAINFDHLRTLNWNW